MKGEENFLRFDSRHPLRICCGNDIGDIHQVLYGRNKDFCEVMDVPLGKNSFEKIIPKNLGRYRMYEFMSLLYMKSQNLLTVLDLDLS